MYIIDFLHGMHHPGMFPIESLFPLISIGLQVEEAALLLPLKRSSKARKHECIGKMDKKMSLKFHNFVLTSILKIWVCKKSP